MKTRANHFFLFLLCVLFFSHSAVCATVDWTTNMCGTSGTITIEDNVNFKCMQVIPDGVTVTINGATEDGKPKYAFWNKLYLDSESTTSTAAWCMFDIKPGGKLIINNMDVNGNAHHTYDSGFDFAGTNRDFRIGIEDGWTNNADYRPLPYGAFHNSGHLELNNCKVHDVVSKQYYISDDDAVNKERRNAWFANGAITITSNALGTVSNKDVPSNGKSLYTKLKDCKFYENIFYSGSVIFTRQLDTGAGATNKIHIENCEIYNNVQRDCKSLEGNSWGGIIRT